MFAERDLSATVSAVRETHAPDALVLETERDFEVLDPAVAEELGLLVDRLEPHRYPAAWLPPDVPEELARYAGSAFTIGAPGDGSVVWTRQTTPPTVLIKPRVEGSPPAFVEFLLAEALVEVGLDVAVPGPNDDSPPPDAGGVDTASAPPPHRPPPEHFLGFFRGRYPDLATATPLDPAGTYQFAAALYDGWLGLHTRETFANWAAAGADDLAPLGSAWADAGDRLTGRLEDLPREVARGETGFAEAAELACAAIKHDLALPSPFGALNTDAYRSRGPPFAIRWAEKTFEALE